MMLKQFAFLFVLSGTVFAQAPSLPAGLGGSTEESFSDFESESPFVFNGFIEGRAGMRTQNQDYQLQIT